MAHIERPQMGLMIWVGWFLVVMGVLGALRNFGVHGSGSLFGALLLLLVGGAMVFHHELPAWPLAEWIARYWPILLIVWGVIRIIEYYAIPGRTARRLRGGEILLLGFLIFAGLSYSGVYRFRHADVGRYFGFNPGDWNPMLDTYPFHGNAQAVLTPGQSVAIRGIRGNITLVAGAGTQVSADVSDSVRAEDQESAASTFQRAQPIIREEGNRLLVLPAGDFTGSSVEANLTLTMPPGTPVEVNTNVGNVSAHSWMADISAKIGSSADSVLLQGVKGQVNIQGRGDDLQLSDINGAVSIDGEYVGALHFHNLSRGIRFTSSRTQLNAATVLGDLNFDLEDINATNFASLDLQTRDKEIHVTHFSGPLSIHNQHDSITVTATEAPLAPISLTTVSGDLEVGLPAASRFEVDASARRGEIHSDFPVSVQSDDRQAVAHAVVGPSPGTPPAPVHIKLETSNGTISIHSH